MEQLEKEHPVRVARSLGFCIVFCRSLIVPMSFILWPLCCVSFFGCWWLLWYYLSIYLTIIRTSETCRTHPILNHISSLPVFSGVCVTQILVFCVVFCRSFFVLLSFLLAIVLSVFLRFTTSDYPLWYLQIFLYWN